MSHPLWIALALLIAFAAAGDATAARRVNFSPAKHFCSLAKGFCATGRKRTHTRKVARKPGAATAPAVAKAEPAPETLPANVAAIPEFAQEPPLPPEAEEITALPIPAPVLRPVRAPSEAVETAALVIPIPVPRPLHPPAAASMPTHTMRDRQRSFEMHEAYRQLAKAEALRQGIPFPLVDAVMKVESGYDASAHGAAGEIGLMQVMPGTAAVLGFQGTDVDLQEPAVNITLGTTYLARAWSLAKKDICTTVMKYRAGHGESRFSELSVRYCERVRAHLMASGFPVTGSLPKVDLLPQPPVAVAVAVVDSPEEPKLPKLMIPEFSELAEFGDWLSHKDSHVWVPRNTEADWRPYTVGHWAFTKDDGWVWVSEEPFGWATYHYGRWGYDEDIGWHWVQGGQWAPAWDTWRRSAWGK